MKLAKRLLVLVAAMTMVLGLVACGGEKYPLEYKYEVEWVQGTRGEVATLTLNEDGTFEYTYTATDSKDANKNVMNCKVTGTYTKEDNLVTVEILDGECNAMNGDTPVDLGKGGYDLTYSQGATKFEVEGDTFVPVE